MGSEMKAAAAEASFLTKVFKPWITQANESWYYKENPITKVGIGDKSLSHINFNSKIDLWTFGLSFFSFFYGVGLEAPWRAKGAIDNRSTFKAASHGFISNWLPKLLAGHEVWKRGTTMAWGEEKVSPLSFVIGLTKIFLCFADKLPKEDWKKTFNSAIGSRLKTT